MASVSRGDEVSIVQDAVLERETRYSEVGGSSVHVEHIVESRWLYITHNSFDHHQVQALGDHAGVVEAELAKGVHARGFEVLEVFGVVDHAHRISVGEPNADARRLDRR